MNKTMTPTFDELIARIDLLSKQVESLSKDNENLALENRRLVAEKAESDAQMARLIEQIKLANMRYFGSKSERVVPDQLSLFNEMEAYVDSSVAEPKLDDVLEPRPRKRGGKRKINFEALETVVITHELPLDEQTCPQCSDELVEMKEEITRTVKLVPAHLIVEEHHRKVYICKSCSKKNAEGEEVKALIKRAPMPNPPIPGSFASPSLLSYIINAKYANSLPLYRLENDFKTLDIEISRQNMANWVINVYDRWLTLIHARMKEKLLGQSILHADETEIQVLKEPNREAKAKSYMWVFRSAKCADKPACIFEYHPTRAASVPRAFLKGWSGTLMTDGYDPYYSLGKNITNTACLVHVRRKFAEVVKVAGGDIAAARVESVALQGRKYIDEMFRIDKAFDEMTPEKRKAERLLELAPKMYAFKDWCEEQIVHAVPKMGLHKALDYALKYWPYVLNVLDDGRLELDNNIAERACRAFVIGRVNWMFSDTPNGAHASAAMYSIVITAKLNGLKPREYIEWLLTEMPNTENITSKGVLDRFMPWSEEVPHNCFLSKAKAKEEAELPDKPILDVDPEAFDEN